MARRRRRELPGQQAFDLDALADRFTAAPRRNLARRIPAPPGFGRPAQSPSPSEPTPPTPPSEPGRPARRLARRLNRGQFDAGGVDTREIAARQTTGIAARTIASDIEAEFDMFPVASSRVNEMGYNEDLQVVRVRFRDGTPWEYRGVPPDVWQGFKQSESPGRFINAVLNEFPYGRGRF